MNLLREYIRKLIDQETDLMIPPPPTESDRIKELSEIQRQYHSRYNPEEIQDALDSVAGSFNSLLTAAGILSQENLLKQLKNEILPIIDLHKNYFDIERPNELARRHNIDFKSDYLESAKTQSYPSGHSAQAYYIAEKLSKIYPGLSRELMTMADMISQSRIDRGVHFPSDIKAGKLLGMKLAKRAR